ncbi:MAG: chromosomal replication initiator protein DnaA [Pantoea sp. Brub]|nr:chromosomal replication initiator protein DnaA [Pantoea sp. Brub]
MVLFNLWEKCLARLQSELPSREFSMWIRPLHAEIHNNSLNLYAPNKFVLEWVRDKYHKYIYKLMQEFCINSTPSLHFRSSICSIQKKKNVNTHLLYSKQNSQLNQNVTNLNSNINNKYKFENFVKGVSNELAYELAYKVANDINKIDYNPLFFCGANGLGKTHLLHAIGNNIINDHQNINILYIHTETFVQNMITALKNNFIEEFKIYYQKIDILLIDDVQFFANKKRSQKEFCYILNYLLEKKKQVILTSDRHPKEINDVQDYLTSRFEWGLTILIKPPELKNRMAIIIKKANENHITLSNKIAFFIAKNFHSNVRELEGVLNRIICNASFSGCKINLNFVQKILTDLLYANNNIITINDIQKIVSQFYNITILDLISKSRLSSIVRPRQIAIAIAKQLTCHSLPEIGNAFGGRDHSTVLYTCRKIKQLSKENPDIKKDIYKLIKLLSC